MTQLSIILPVYNCEEYIGECIESILCQDFSGFELIIIDDGSTDSSLQVCERFRQDSRVRMITQENFGVSVARNRGLSEASAPYVMFVDSDDIMAPGMLSAMFIQITDSGADLCVCGIKNFKGFHCKDEIWTYLPGTYTKGEFADVLLKFYTLPFIGGPYAKLYRYDIIEKRGILFEPGESFAEDFVFNMRYLRYVERVSVLGDALYLRRADNATSLSKRKQSQAPLWKRKKDVFREWNETLACLSDCQIQDVVLLQRLAVESLTDILLSGEYDDGGRLIRTIFSDTDNLVRGRRLPSYELIRALCIASPRLCASCLRLACIPTLQHNPVFKMLNR